MGVDFRAKLIYGLPSGEIQELLDDSEGDYVYHNHGFDKVSPYYGKYWVIGITIANSDSYGPTELNLEELHAKLEEAKKKFFEIIGKEGKLYLSPHGS